MSFRGRGAGADGLQMHLLRHLQLSFLEPYILLVKASRFICELIRPTTVLELLVRYSKSFHL